MLDGASLKMDRVNKRSVGAPVTAPNQPMFAGDWSEERIISVPIRFPVGQQYKIESQTEMVDTTVPDFCLTCVPKLNLAFLAPEGLVDSDCNSTASRGTHDRQDRLACLRLKQREIIDSRR